MKRIFVGSVLVFGLISSGYSFAADKPLATSDWDGFYAGVNTGYNWSPTDSDTYSTVTGAFLGPGNTEPSGIISGGRFGYDHMISENWLLGLLTDISYSKLTVDRTISNTGGTNVHNSLGVGKFNGSVLGRAGYAMKQWLFYGLGGWTWSDAKSTRTQLIGTTGTASAGTVERDRFLRNGWTLGSGLEVLLTPHFSFYSEYRYTGYRTDHITFPLAQNTSDVKGYDSLIIVGINYKF